MNLQGNMRVLNAESLSNCVDYDLRENGVVYTPLPVARAVVAQAMAHISSSNLITVLEPSCGDGAFLRALASESNIQKFALDKDREAIAHCETMFTDTSLHNGNFFDSLPSNWPMKYDLILGNPPYVRWHRCERKTREDLKNLCDDHNYKSSQLKNVWAGFVIRAIEKLSSRGVLAFVIPYEFLNVAYGKHLKSWMETKFATIDIYVPDEKAFKSIDQDAVTIIAAKGAGPCCTKIHRVSALSKIRSKASCIVSNDKNDQSALMMKGFLLEPKVLELIGKLQSKCQNVSELCDNAAGTVTAANDFFILSKDAVAKHQLKRWAKPIVKKSGFLGRSVNFDKSDFSNIELSGKSCYLLDFAQLNPAKLPKAVERYIELGKEQGLHLRYKCRHRSHWYQVPFVEAKDGLFFKRSHIVPRLCVNNCDVLATDSAYHIRMKQNFDIQSLCASFYNSLTLLFAEIEGRFYGGGVLELTPNEFRRLPVPYHEISEDYFVQFAKRFTLADQGQAAIRFVNEAVRVRLGISHEEVEQLEAARECLQAHRLRHGTVS